MAMHTIKLLHNLLMGLFKDTREDVMEEDIKLEDDFYNKLYRFTEMIELSQICSKELYHKYHNHQDCLVK